jgi:hypothetical protein
MISGIDITSWEFDLPSQLSMMPRVSPFHISFNE